MFRDEASLPEYKGEDFDVLPQGEENHVFRFAGELKELPTVPAGRRLMIRNTKMALVYDSQLAGEYKPVKDGYISFV